MMLFSPPVISTTTDRYPYAAMSSSLTNLVYSGATLYSGPFNAQFNNVVGYYPDQLKCMFQCTQSLLNASGRIYCGVFYENPNNTFAMNIAGIFDATTTFITPSGI